MDTKSKHSSIAIKKMTLDSLEEYDIPLTNVLVGVTDNAANMVKCMADLNSLHEKELVGGGQVATTRVTTMTRSTERGH